MIKDVLQNIDSMVFGQIAMILFGLIFIAVVIYAWTRPKKQMDEWSHIPLSDEPKHEQKQ
jgi:cbb3-type cytochrome oxidase subunit 3